MLKNSKNNSREKVAADICKYLYCYFCIIPVIVSLAERYNSKKNRKYPIKYIAPYIAL